MKPITLQEISKYAEALRKERDVLAARVAALNKIIDEATMQALPGIRRAVCNAGGAHALLHVAIDTNRQLFERPRTITVHGFKVGLHKGKGRVTCDDPDRAIALIKRYLPAKSEDLIQTKEILDLEAIRSLDAVTLARIGCEVEATGDAVLIKPTDSAVDKIVKALLKSATDESLTTDQKEAA